MEENRDIPAGELLDPRTAEECAQAVRKVTAEIEKAVKGKNDVIQMVLLAILARGHILLEDIPGVGKTTLALAFSRVMQLSYNRVQFTPDVMPSDVTGYSVFVKGAERFEFVRGAAMCNLLLADEINRTSSRTQSALLEVMEEGAVTVDLKRYETPKPFTVIATQNPVGYAGTQLLPESQLDRFLIRLTMGYPDRESEVGILKSKTGDGRLEALSPLLSGARILQMQQAVDRVHVDDSLYDYLVALAEATRRHDLIELGISPRGTIALLRMSRARALVMGRSYLLPEDVARVGIPCMAHRLVLRSKARAAGKSAADLLRDIFEAVPPPRVLEERAR